MCTKRDYGQLVDHHYCKINPMICCPHEKNHSSTKTNFVWFDAYIPFIHYKHTSLLSPYFYPPRTDYSIISSSGIICCSPPQAYILAFQTHSKATHPLSTGSLRSLYERRLTFLSLCLWQLSALKRHQPFILHKGDPVSFSFQAFKRRTILQQPLHYIRTERFHISPVTLSAWTDGILNKWKRDRVGCICSSFL